MSPQLIMTRIKEQMSPLSTGTLQGMLPSASEMPVTDSSDNYGRVLEVSHILHSSLSADEILRQFSIELSKEVRLDGLIFTNTDEQLDVQIGTVERYSLEYDISLQTIALGQLKLSRKEPFTETEINTFEDFSGSMNRSQQSRCSSARS